MANDAALIALVSSANIACGYHAGSLQLMEQTVRLCKQQGVAVGAHPSFPDRDNFGRTEMEMPHDELHNLVMHQILLMQQVCNAEGVQLHHVKPHGALYNMCARDAALASIVASAVAGCSKELWYYGMAGTVMINEAEVVGLRVVPEFFADRRYDSVGRLVSRNKLNALLHNESDMLAQARSIILTRSVTNINGDDMQLSSYHHPATICLHGDGEHAIAFAESIRKLCVSLQVNIASV